MKKYHLLLVAAIIIAFAGCSNNKNKSAKARINATITVADSIDASGDYSGIQLLITNDKIGGERDTLFIAQTDTLGNLKGQVEVPEQGLYPVAISRSGNLLFNTQAILAANDTLNITGELPGLEQTFEVVSKEETAFKVYKRVEHGFNRVLAFMQTGALSDSTLPAEISKWSDLYWEAYTKHPETIGSLLSARESIRILDGFDNELMKQRLNESLKNERMIEFAADFGTEMAARERGLEASIKYLDSLKTLTKNEKLHLGLDIAVISAYYDSSEVDRAQSKLDNFKKKYKKDERAMAWADDMDYDFKNLSLGKEIPEFSFTTFEGDTLSNESVKGTAYILEITSATNNMYQDQIDRTYIIQQIYSEYGLNVFTIPIDRSEITVQALFDEFENPWPVAVPGSFDVTEVLEKFNVSKLPTRFLVDTEGKIVRKYELNEFSDVIGAINGIFNRNSKEEIN